jgi:drug/metabolite transporter (DMT)-like permease
MLPASLATFLFALSSVSAKRAVHYIGPNNASLARICLAGVFLALYAHSWGSGFAGVGLMWFLVSGIIGFGICDTAIFLALPRLGAQLTTLLVQCLAVPIATGTEWLWLGTQLTIGQIFSMGLILAGVAMALYPGTARPSRSTAAVQRSGLVGLNVSMGAIGLGVLAAAGQAWGAVLSRHGQQLALEAGESIDGLTVTYQRIVPGVIFIAIWWGLHRWHAQTRLRPATRVPEAEPIREMDPTLKDPTLDRSDLGASDGLKSGMTSRFTSDRWRVMPWIVINALSGPTLGVGCYQWALATTPTGVVTAITALTPLAVIPLAWKLDGERPTVRSVLGGVVAVGGAVGLRWAGV